MDKATLIGLVMGIGAVLGGQALEGGSIHSIMQFTAAVIVFGGTFGAVFLSYPFHNVLGAFKDLRIIIKEPLKDPVGNYHPDLPSMRTKLGAKASYPWRRK